MHSKHELNYSHRAGKEACIDSKPGITSRLLDKYRAKQNSSPVFLDKKTNNSLNKFNEMNKNYKRKNNLIQLYNPKDEGIGDYDQNYTNAYNKLKKTEQMELDNTNREIAA